jgi:hypothetical protein
LLLRGPLWQVGTDAQAEGRRYCSLVCVNHSFTFSHLYLSPVEATSCCRAKESLAGGSGNMERKGRQVGEPGHSCTLGNIGLEVGKEMGQWQGASLTPMKRLGTFPCLAPYPGSLLYQDCSEVWFGDW